MPIIARIEAARRVHDLARVGRCRRRPPPSRRRLASPSQAASLIDIGLSGLVILSERRAAAWSRISARFCLVHLAVTDVDHLVELVGDRVGQIDSRLAPVEEIEPRAGDMGEHGDRVADVDVGAPPDALRA